MIYFHGLQNWTMQEKCAIVYMGIFLAIDLSEFLFLTKIYENKSLAKINLFTVHVVSCPSSTLFISIVNFDN